MLRTTPGYTGGTKTNPTDEEVLSGMTGHAEAIEVVYDPSKVSYEKLLDVFWHNIDPLTRNAQFCDHGTQYRTAIFYHDDAQRRLAEAAKSRIETSAGLQEPDRHANRQSGNILPGRRLSPGTLRQELRTIRVLSQRLRPRRALAAGLGCGCSDRLKFQARCDERTPLRRNASARTPRQRPRAKPRRAPASRPASRDRQGSSRHTP